MNRWLEIMLIVAAAFSFTLVCMFVGGSPAATDPMRYLCAHLMGPGMAITVYWLHAKALGEAFGWLSVAVNTLIYSALFGSALGLLRFMPSWRKSQS